MTEGKIYGYVYKTTCIDTGKIYVGQKKSCRFLNDYFGSGVEIRRAVEKYGKEHFTVELLDTALDKDSLNQLEKDWIEKLDARNRNVGYNIAVGGTLIKYWTGKHRSEETKEKLRKIFTGRKLHSDDAKRRIGRAKKGIPRTSQDREKIRIGMLASYERRRNQVKYEEKR